MNTLTKPIKKGSVMNTPVLTKLIKKGSDQNLIITQHISQLLWMSLKPQANRSDLTLSRLETSKSGLLD